MNYREIQKKCQAAQVTLSSSFTTGDKIRALSQLLKGINPKVDLALKECSAAFNKLEKLEKFKVLELTAETLPESTEEDKQRKKLLILFLNFWNDLKSEVGRVEKEIANMQNKTQSTPQTLGNILGALKGPLGIITFIATGIVLLSQTSVKIKITNDGCDPLLPNYQLPLSIRIPGLKLPNSTIPSGASEELEIPPVPLTADGTTPNTIKLSGVGLSYIFNLEGSGIDVLYNKRSLLGTKTQINLNRNLPQEIKITCN